MSTPIITPRTPATPPKPGMYPDIGPADYHRWGAWSQSMLKQIGEWDQNLQAVVPSPEKSPAHLWHYLHNSEDSTEAQEFGTALHALWLEPERFKREYCVLSDKIDRRTKDGKARWESLVSSFGEDRIITADDWKILEGMAHAAASHEFAQPLLGAEGQCEVSIVWEDEETGLTCKTRLDKLIVANHEEYDYAIVDPKTTRCSHWRVFEADASSYGYHIQAAVNVDAIYAATGKRARHFLIAQEKTAPYPVVVYPVPPEAVESGRVIYRAMLKEAARCMKLGKWPAYADDRLIDLTLKPWAHAEIVEPAEAPKQNRQALAAAR